MEKITVSSYYWPGFFLPELGSLLFRLSLLCSFFPSLSFSLHVCVVGYDVFEEILSKCCVLSIPLFLGRQFRAQKKYYKSKNDSNNNKRIVEEKKNCHAIQFSDHMKIFRHVCSSLLFLIFAQRNKQIVASSLQSWII